MSNSWGFDYSQLYPPHFCAHSKITLGWLKPQNVQYGVNLLSAAELSNPEHAQVIKIRHGYKKGEYLLIENRQAIGFDAGIPQGGLAIWHVDEMAEDTTQGYPGQTDWPRNGMHYRIALLQADGRYNLEKGDNSGGSQDVFQAGYMYQLLPSSTDDVMKGPFPNTDAYQGGIVTKTGNRILSISSSGNVMTFTYTDPDEPLPSSRPTTTPSEKPTTSPSDRPTPTPTNLPSMAPTDGPTSTPSKGPTTTPSTVPSPPPTTSPSHTPTIAISPSPSNILSGDETEPPSSRAPSNPPTQVGSIGGNKIGVTYTEVTQMLIGHLLLNGHQREEEISLSEWDEIDGMVDALFATSRRKS
jgi:hypothetical protein